jgi:hypothetical protein
MIQFYLGLVVPHVVPIGNLTDALHFPLANSLLIQRGLTHGAF